MLQMLNLFVSQMMVPLSAPTQYNICSSCILGPKTMVNEFSCVCLHGDRRPQERRDNLQAFKVNSVPISSNTSYFSRMGKFVS